MEATPDYTSFSPHMTIEYSKCCIPILKSSSPKSIREMPSTTSADIFTPRSLGKSGSKKKRNSKTMKLTKIRKKKSQITMKKKKKRKSYLLRKLKFKSC
jgi:hypothetical protein